MLSVIECIIGNGKTHASPEHARTLYSETLNPKHNPSSLKSQSREAFGGLTSKPSLAYSWRQPCVCVCVCECVCVRACVCVCFLGPGWDLGSSISGWETYK